MCTITIGNIKLNVFQVCFQLFEIFGSFLQIKKLCIGLDILFLLLLLSLEHENQAWVNFAFSNLLLPETKEARLNLGS